MNFFCSIDLFLFKEDASWEEQEVIAILFKKKGDTEDFDLLHFFKIDSRAEFIVSETWRNICNFLEFTQI